MITMTMRYTVRGHFSCYHLPNGTLEENARLDVADMLRHDGAKIEKIVLIMDRPPLVEMLIVGDACTVARWASFGYRVIR